MSDASSSIPAQSALRRMRARLLCLLTAITVSTALAVPFTVWYLGYSSLKTEANTVVDFTADRLSRFAARFPYLWAYQHERLYDLIAFQPLRDFSYQRLLDPEGNIIVEDEPHPMWLALTLATPVEDSLGQTVAHLQILVSLDSVIRHTALAFLCGAFLSISLFFLFRTVVFRLMEENAQLRTNDLLGQNLELSRALAALHIATVSKNFLDRILSSLFEGVIVVNERGEVIRANAAAARLLGRPDPGALIKQPIDRLIPGFTIPGSAVIEKHHPYFACGSEGHALTAGGNAVPVLISGSVLPECDGDEATYVLSLWDISDHKRSEMAVRESRHQLKQLLESITDGFCSFDQDWRCTYINTNGLRLLRMRAENVLDKPIWYLFPNLRGAGFESIAADTVKTGQKSSLVHFSEAHQAWWSFTLNPYRQGFSIILQDVTDRKTAEDEVRRLNQELECRVAARTAELHEAQAELIRKNRLAILGQLAATVSHELRNPLGVIRHSAYVVRHFFGDDELRPQRALDRIERSVGRCDRIIDEMLDFARPRPLSVQTVSLHSWLLEIVGEAPIPPETRVTVSTSPEDIQVRIDREAMRRALLNLIDNACQAMQADEVVVTGQRPAELVISTHIENSMVALTILDTGGGVQLEILPKIFEPLFSTKGFGAGLGLPIVKRIVEAHGGRITIANRSDQPGASAHVVFPVGADTLTGNETEEAA